MFLFGFCTYVGDDFDIHSFSASAGVCIEHDQDSVLICDLVLFVFGSSQFFPCRPGSSRTMNKETPPSAPPRVVRPSFLLASTPAHVLYNRGRNDFAVRCVKVALDATGIALLVSTMVLTCSSQCRLPSLPGLSNLHVFRLSNSDDCCVPHTEHRWPTRPRLSPRLSA